MSDRDAYDEVYVYTMRRPDFPLQYVVDAYAAQHATAETKPITLLFALVGLFLHLERGLTGHEVQRVHMRMGRDRREWPRLIPPEVRGSYTAADVRDTNPGPERDEAIESWCRDVWAAYADSHDLIATIAELYRNAE